MAKDAKNLKHEIAKTEEQMEKYDKTLGPAATVIRQVQTKKESDNINFRMTVGVVGNYREQVKRLVYAKQNVKSEDYRDAVFTMDNILKYNGPNKEKLYTRAGLDCTAYARQLYKSNPDRALEFNELAHDFEKKAKKPAK